MINQATGVRSLGVLGTMTFGDTVDVDGAREMLAIALDHGITAVDTANGYAGTRSESMLGDLLAGRRSHVQLATKAGIPHPDAQGAAPLSKAGLDRCLTASLGRLRTDAVDLFYLHQPDPLTPLEDTVAAVADILRSGRAGAWGVSNFASWQLYRLIQLAREASIPAPVAAQQLYSILARRIEDEFVAGAVAAGVPIIAYNPLCGGLLTGRHQPDAPPGSGRFGTSALAEMYRGRYWHRELFDGVERLSAVAAAAHIPLVELALRWVAFRSGVGGVLLGGSRPEHMAQNAAALTAGPLADDVVDACTKIGDTLAGVMPRYNR